MLYDQLNRQKERQTLINQTRYINIKHQIEICIKLLSFVICPTLFLGLCPNIQRACLKESTSQRPLKGAYEI